jgi:CMP-N,N'-diacetyllegionaminic acid synthase
MPALNNDVVAIILARGGSKGLVRKNILPLNGIPLIAHTIKDAINSDSVTNVIVSTDDMEIMKISQQHGAEVPWLRPKELATDLATTEDALQHAVRWLVDQNRRPTVVVYLQATEPFRPNWIIDACVKKLIGNKTLDSVFAATPTHKNYWLESKSGFKMLNDAKQYGLPRQVKQTLYREDTGIALASRTNVILEGKRIGASADIVPYEHIGSLIDIHTKADFKLASLLALNFDDLTPRG